MSPAELGRASAFLLCRCAGIEVFWSNDLRFFFGAGERDCAKLDCVGDEPRRTSAQPRGNAVDKVGKPVEMWGYPVEMSG